MNKILKAWFSFYLFVQITTKVFETVEDRFVGVVVDFLSQVNFIFFCFNFISVHLTIPKNKTKTKITSDKKKTTT